MQCSEIREMLSAYIDDVLDEQEKEAVTHHLHNCSSCSQELSDLRETIELLQALGEVSPPEEFRKQVLARVEKEHPSVKTGHPGWRKILSRFPGSWQQIAAAVLIIGLGIGTGLYSLSQARMGSKVSDIALDTRSSAFKVANERQSNVPNETPESQSGKEKSGADSRPSTGLPETPRGSNNLQTEGFGGGSGATSSSQPQAGNDGTLLLNNNSRPTTLGMTPPTTSGDRKTAAKAKAEVAPDRKNLAQTKVSQIDQGATSGKPQTTVKGQTEPVTENASSPDSKIIRDGVLTLEVENFKEFGTRLSTMVEHYAGYIENSSENTGEIVTASFVIRVPAVNFNELVSRIESLGKATGKQIAGRDVTGEVIDAQSRLRNLERQEQRLLGLMDKAGSVSDMLSTESEMGRVRGEIEVLQGRLKNLDNAVIYSTIRLEVREVAKLKVAPAQGVFGKALRNFTESIVYMLNMIGDFIALAGWLLPWLLGAGLVGGAIYYYRRGHKKG